jgi:dipeptidyl aminopeptidase/acylaminoacyl peptidase
LVHDAAGPEPLSWHPDNEHLLITKTIGGGKLQLLTLDVRTGEEKHYIDAIGVGAARFSPDGRWVAYQSDENGSTEVYISSYPEPTAKYRVSTAGGSAPRWRRDGGELYFIGQKETIFAVTVSTGQRALTLGKPQALFSFPMMPYPWDRNSYDVDASGTNFVVTTRAEANPSELVLVTDWTP